MAIFNEDYFVDESAYDEDEILDGMLEACDDMMDDMDELYESTAAQRHYGVTARDVRRDELGDYKEMPHMDSVERAEYLKTLKGAAIGQNKMKRSDAGLDKNYPNADNFKNATHAKAAINGFMGAGNTYMASKYKMGKNIKKTYKDVDRYMKKKRAVKEACLQILADLDEV